MKKIVKWAVMGMAAVAASAITSVQAVDYYDPSDGTVKASPNATTLTTQTTLSGGWYVVPAGTTTINDRITVSNNVNLVLCDGATLNANSGISVTGGNSLTIWGQGGEHVVSGTSVTTRGTGALNAQTPGSGDYHQTAAIGGETGGTSTGDIVINGGVIVARGSWGAGIGRGNVAGGAVGSVTINEGHVTASGSKGSAGIGSGAYADSCPVTISGGYVVAAGSAYGDQATPGIGTGRPRTNGSEPLSNGPITIIGGTVIAEAGTPPSGGTAAQAIGVNAADADHNGTSRLVLGAVRAYASADATTPVASAARGDTCRSAWVKLEACTDHSDSNADNICDYCGGLRGSWTGSHELDTVKVTKFYQSYPYSGKAMIEYTVGRTLPPRAIAEITLSTDDASATFVQSNIVAGANSHVIDFASSFGGALLLTNASFVVTIMEVDLGGVQLWENGPYWAECNVGASRPEEYGYYFWWGDTVGYTCDGGTLVTWWGYGDVTWVSSTGEQMSSSLFAPGSPFAPDSSCPTYEKENAELLSAGYIDSTGNLVAAHDAATAHLGAPWRMPTSAEIEALVSNCTTTWITTNGVSGYLVTGMDAYANRSIFLPAAGDGDGSSLYGPGSYGFYWSSTPDSDGSNNAGILFFDSDFFSWSNENRYVGRPVRPVRGFAQ